jgi:hypothetical protein
MVDPAIRYHESGTNICCRICFVDPEIAEPALAEVGRFRKELDDKRAVKRTAENEEKKK